MQQYYAMHFYLCSHVISNSMLIPLILIANSKWATTPNLIERLDQVAFPLKTSMTGDDSHCIF